MIAGSPAAIAATMRIPLARPDIGEAERHAVLEVLSGDWLSMGPVTEEFEMALASRSGTTYAVATSSGTSALHIAVCALGLEGGDEAITTPFSFVASSNCLLFEGVRPVFVDVEPDTLNIDPDRVKAAIGKRTRAVIAVDVFGHPAEWDALRSLADEFGLHLVEDSAEALGSRYQGRPAGGLGDVGIFGFYPNKQITTGEGGALVTDDLQVARLSRSLRNQGRGSRDGWLEHERLGYNYRLSDISAALGLAQLRRLDELLERRAQVAAWYAKRLCGVHEVRPPTIRTGVEMGWFGYLVRLADVYDRADRDRLISELRLRGIGCHNYFPPIHLQPFYRERFGHRLGDFPVAEAAAARTIALPFFPGLTEAEVDEVVDTLVELLGSL